MKRGKEKWTFSVCLLCVLSCSVSADPQPVLVSARPGGDVTLPCQAPNNHDIVLVEWIRADLERPVYMKSDGHLETADQDPSYMNRVQLKDDEMKNGDLSLVLTNVTCNDKGTYKCLYVGEGGDEQMETISIIILDVKDPQETAHPGDDVTLSCVSPNVNISAVEWIRSDLEAHVYMKQDGFLVTADQDPSYKNRVQLKDDEMKNGDLSLVLKNVDYNDEGTYVCRVEQGKKRGRRMKRADHSEVISIVYLKVEDTDADTSHLVLSAGPGDGDTEGGEYARVEKLVGGGQTKHQHSLIPLLGILNGIVVIVAVIVGFVMFKKFKTRSQTY